MYVHITCPCGFESNPSRFDESLWSVGCAVPVFVPGCERLESVVIVQGEDEPNEVFDALLDERAAERAREEFGETAIPMDDRTAPLPCPVCGRLSAKFKFGGF